jgi:hypothetical protein
MGEIVGFAYASLFGFVMPLAFFGFAMMTARRKEEMLSRERLAAAERGIPVALLERPRIRTQANPRAGALVMLAVGVGFSFALWQSGERDWGWGAIPALIGIALLIHWMAGGGDAFRRQQELNEEAQRAYVDLVRRTDLSPRRGAAQQAAPGAAAVAVPSGPAAPAAPATPVVPISPSFPPV